MVHHTEWDRKTDQRGGYMQKDHDEMEEIIREMSPGGKHYHAFQDGSVKTDAQIKHEGSSSQVVHRGKSYDHSLPSLYHGKWYPSSQVSNQSSFFMTMVDLIIFIIFVFCFLKIAKMVWKTKSKSKSKSKSK